MTQVYVAAVLVAGFLLLFRNVIFDPEDIFDSGTLLDKLANAPVATLDPTARADPTVSDCHHFSCFDVYRCGSHPKKMAVHVADPVNFIAGAEGREVAPWTKEFVEMLEAVEASEYYRQDPESACMFISPVGRILTQICFT